MPKIRGLMSRRVAGLLLSATALAMPAAALAADADIGGSIENVTHVRKDDGLVKARTTAQIEIQKDFEPTGRFSRLSFNAILRGSYDAVYDLRDTRFGENAGGSILLESVAMGKSVPHGGGIPLPAGPINLTKNPNSGMIVLGQPLHDANGGVSFGVPVRPCDVDSRGCIPGYLDYSLNDLRYPEFNKRLDFLREAYVDAAWAVGGAEELGVRIGRQQVVWGRTDLFRVLDVINPVDYSRNNIYDELEDIRIPQWIATAEYRMGGTGPFDDLNLQFVWNFDKFRPSNIGQAGTPYTILDAGSFFRGMKNCWDNGCTVSNFANGNLATDFPSHVIGIRQANLPKWSLDDTQFGGKLEGVFQSVGFSFNYLHTRAQLPTLRGGIPADNAFTPGVEAQAWPYLIAFDIDFPKVDLYGTSLDFYVDSLKSAVRMEFAYTTGEEFANTLRPRLFSSSDVIRYVVGIDRQTFIPFLNPTRSFLISGQIFGQHLLDHELKQGPLGPMGMPDWKNSWIGTLLIKGFYLNDRLSPQIITAYDFKAKAAAIAPSVDWLINDSWQVVLGGNFKVGKGIRTFDDCRSCNPFPPYTATPLHAGGAPGSIGLGGFEPLGRFRSGPIGMAQREDEIQLTVRYRF